MIKPDVKHKTFFEDLLTYSAVGGEKTNRKSSELDSMDINIFPTPSTCSEAVCSAYRKLCAQSVEKFVAVPTRC